MNSDIAKVVSECINNPLVQHYYKKKRNMTYDEKKEQEKNFARMIGYCILFRNSDGIEEYMLLKDSDQQIKYLKNKIANEIGIQSKDIDNRIEEIIDYAFKRFVANGYVFHAGNSRSIEKNMKDGLGSSQTPAEDRLELMHINSIYEKYGNDRPLGWGILDIENHKNGWFYDRTPTSMLYYADSPEWFGQFCGNNHCYAWNFIPEENRHGYANRDYDACLLTITKLIEKNNMNENDRNEIIGFFNKCWAKYGNTNPCLMFVPISSIEDNNLINITKSFYYPSLNKDNPHFKVNSIFFDITEGGCSFMGNNICCDKAITNDVLSYVDLSLILPRFKISEEEKQKELTIQDCIKKLNGLDMERLLQAQEVLNQISSKGNKRRL